MRDLVESDKSAEDIVGKLSEQEGGYGFWITPEGDTISVSGWKEAPVAVVCNAEQFGFSSGGDLLEYPDPFEDIDHEAKQNGAVWVNQADSGLEISGDTDTLRDNFDKLPNAQSYNLSNMTSELESGYAEAFDLSREELKQELGLSG